MNQLTQRSLTAGVITAIVLTTGIVEVMSAFVRTNLTGTPDNSCGYGYGYDTDSGYGNGYGSSCVTGGGAGIVGGGGTYVYTPLQSELNNSTNSGTTSNGSSPSSTGSTTTDTSTGSTSSTGTQSGTGTNPYGTNYDNWDEGMSSDAGENSTSATNGGGLGQASGVGSTSVNPIRRLPATGVN